MYVCMYFLSVLPFYSYLLFIYSMGPGINLWEGIPVFFATECVASAIPLLNPVQSLASFFGLGLPVPVRTRVYRPLRAREELASNHGNT